jgi:hypothetical protein
MRGVNVNGISHNDSPSPDNQGIDAFRSFGRCFPQFCRPKTKTETVARALVFEQRVSKTFGYPRHTPSLTAGDGLAHQVPGEDFRSRSINGCSDFFAEPGT